MFCATYARPGVSQRKYLDLSNVVLAPRNSQKADHSMINWKGFVFVYPKKPLRFLRSNLGILNSGFMKYYYPEGFHTLQVCRGTPFWKSSCVRGDRATTSWPIRCLGGILEVQCSYGLTDLGMRVIIIQLQLALVSPDPKRSNFSFISGLRQFRL